MRLHYIYDILCAHLFGFPWAHLHVVVMLQFIFWHKPTKLAHSFLSCSGVYFCPHGLFNYISLHKFFRQPSAFSLCSSGLNFALLVLSAIYLFRKVSFSSDIILHGWQGLKHQLTNQLTLSPFLPCIMKLAVGVILASSIPFVSASVHASQFCLMFCTFLICCFVRKKVLDKSWLLNGWRLRCHWSMTLCLTSHLSRSSMI